MNKIKDTILQNRPEISTTTLDVYVKNIVRISKIDKEMSIDDIISEQTLLNKFLDKFKANTRKNYLSALMVYTGKSHSMYNTIFKQYTDSRKEIDKNNKVKLQNRNNNLVEWTNLLKVQRFYWALYKKNKIFETKFDDLTPEQKTLYYKTGISAVYTLMKPQKNKWGKVKIVYDEPDIEDVEETNILYVKNQITKFLIVRKYQTATDYYNLILPIPPKLNSVLNGLLKSNKSQYLFPNHKNFTDEVYNTFKLVGDKLGSTQLTHIYNVHKYGKDYK